MERGRFNDISERQRLIFLAIRNKNYSDETRRRQTICRLLSINSYINTYGIGTQEFLREVNKEAKMIDKIHDNENNQSYVDFQKHEININTINSQNEN